MKVVQGSVVIVDHLVVTPLVVGSPVVLEYLMFVVVIVVVIVAVVVECLVVLKVETSLLSVVEVAEEVIVVGKVVVP